ncbi:MAG: Fic family protein [Euryarchaeota archaeon]|nr:Fic family protein [Euryarchaeota archaeon]
MVTVARKRIGTRDYYYLQHTIRRGAKVSKKEVYLGPRLPRDVEARKRQLQLDLFREQWLPRLDRIRKEVRHESKGIPSSLAAKRLQDFAVRFTYDTQRIEGSTLSLRETADLLDRGITPANKPVQDVREAEAHEALFHEVLRYTKDLNRQIVLKWHRSLFLSTRPDIAGQFRRHGVRISGSRFVPPLPVEVEPLMRDFFAWYHRARDAMHPVERAALVHLKVVTVHPFGDGNGRVSRLLMNLVLKQARFPLLNIPYENRASYYRALERSQTRRDDLPFLRWFFRQYAKNHRHLLG